jgi:hypothetical protein
MSTTAPAATRSVWRAGLLTAGVAAVANTLVYLLGLLTPASFEVTQAGETVTVLPFLPAVASVMGVLAGTVALWVLARFSWGLTVWTVLAVVVGIGSIAQPLLLAQDTWTGIVLAVMHPLTLLIALVLLRPAGRTTA